MRMGRTHHHLLKFHTLWHTAIRTPLPPTPTSKLHLVWWNSHDTSVVIRSVSKWFNRAKNLRKWITKNVKQNKAISNHDEWLHKVQKREFNMSNEWTGRLCFSVSVWKVKGYTIFITHLQVKMVKEKTDIHHYCRIIATQKFIPMLARLL